MAAPTQRRESQVKQAKMARTAALLVLAVLAVSLPVANTSAARLAKPGSTHPSFPMDVFSKPAYKLVYADDDPISNHSAIELLLRYGQVHGSQPQADIEAFDRGKSEEQVSRFTRPHTSSLAEGGQISPTTLPRKSTWRGRLPIHCTSAASQRLSRRGRL